MKQLLLAAALAAIGSAAFADVYNVKFTATTAVGATKKVSGQPVDYFKKGTVVVQGLYDDATQNYYFWKGTKQPYEVLKDVVFEGANQAAALDDVVNGKNLTLNANLLWGNSEESVDNAFVAAGMGTAIAAQQTTLASAKGNFAGKIDGNPAYGSWSYSKNAAATKDLAGYLAKLGFSENDFDLQANKNTTDKFNAWKAVAKGAVATKQELEELLGVTIPALQDDIASLEGDKAALEDQNAALENDKAALQDAIDNLIATIKTLNNSDTMAQALLSYLQEQKVAMESVITSDPTEQLNSYETLKAAIKPYEETLAAKEAALKVFTDKEDAAQAKLDGAYFMETLYDGSYFDDVLYEVAATNTLIQSWRDTNNSLRQTIADTEASIDAGVVTASNAWDTAEAAATVALEAWEDAEALAESYTLEQYLAENGIDPAGLTLEDMAAYEATQEAQAADAAAKKVAYEAAAEQARTLKETYEALKAVDDSNKAEIIAGIRAQIAEYEALIAAALANIAALEAEKAYWSDRVPTESELEAIWDEAYALYDAVSTPEFTAAKGRAEDARDVALWALDDAKADYDELTNPTGTGYTTKVAEIAALVGVDPDGEAPENGYEAFVAARTALLDEIAAKVAIAQSNLEAINQMIAALAE